MPGQTNLANDAWEALLSAHAVLMKQFAAEDIWADVSMREYDVLYTLSKCPEPLRISELNRHVLLSQPALSRLVDRLAERGLIERRADPADGRGVRLSLTARRPGPAAPDRAPARPQRRPGHDRRAHPDRTRPAGNDLPEAGRSRTRTGTCPMNAPAEAEPFRLAVVSAGTSDPSSTRLLADRTAERAAALAARHGNTVTVSVVELREIAADISTALVSQLITPKLQQAITVLGEADGIIAAAPVYKAGPSGLFTSFFDVLDNDLLIAKPVVLAATAGTARHALVADDQMRPMFAYLRTMTVPTSLFAAPEDWSDPALAKRIDRAALELVLLMESGFARRSGTSPGQSYQHEYGSAGGTEPSIDLDTDLMRLADRRIRRIDQPCAAARRSYSGQAGLSSRASPSQRGRLPAGPAPRRCARSVLEALRSTSPPTGCVIDMITPMIAPGRRSGRPGRPPGAPRAWPPPRRSRRSSGRTRRAPGPGPRARSW